MKILAPSGAGVFVQLETLQIFFPPLVQAVPVLVARLGPVGSNVGAAVADESAVAEDLVELLPLLQVQLLLRCPSHLHSPANRINMRKTVFLNRPLKRIRRQGRPCQGQAFAKWPLTILNPFCCPNI